MTTPYQLPKPLYTDLIKSFLTEHGFDPLICGMDSYIRVHCEDDSGAAVSLSGASATMVFTPRTTGVPVTLSTATAINGPLFEIKIDTDQSAEDISDPSNPTGKGWLQINFSSFAAFVTKITPLIGSGTYKLEITFGDGSKRRLMMGQYEIL